MVNKEIKNLSLKKLNSLRYKTSSCKTGDVEILSYLQELLEAKEKGSECLREFDKEDIVNTIKKYL